MPDKLIAQIISLPVTGEKTTKAELELTSCFYNGKATLSTGKILAYFKNSKNLNLHYGDIILLHSRLNEVDEPRNPGAFSYKNHLRKKNIFHSTYVKENEFRILKNEDVSFFYDVATKIKLRLLAILKANKLEGQELAIASSLLLGYDEDISSQLSNAYAITGTIHVLSVSGMHLGIIFMVLNLMLGFLDKTKKGMLFKGALVLLGIWLFALISGLSPSVVRAAVMFSLFIFGKSFRLQSNIFNTLLASAFLVLLADPFLILDIGFQLSYLALGGILFFQPKIYNWFQLENYLLDKTWALTSVSLAAQLTTFPISMYYFNNFSISFLIANLIIIPLSTLIMYGGILLLASSFATPVSNFIALLLKHIIIFMNKCTYFMSELPGSHISGIFVTGVETLLIYFLLFTASAYFITNRKKQLYFALAGCIALLVSFNLDNYFNSTKSEFIIYHNKNSSCIDIFSGNNFISIGNHFPDAEKNRILHNGKEILHLPLKENIEYSVNGFSFVAPSEKYNSSYSPALVLLQNNRKLKVSTIKAKFPDAIIISDGTNRFNKNLKWKKAADSLNLKFWITAEKGAFRITHEQTTHR